MPAAMNLERAAALHEAGRYAEAEEGCRAILARHPRNPDAWHLLGLALWHAGRGSEAVEAIRRAIRLRPAAAALHNNLGAVLESLGQREEAVACYRRVAELERRPADSLVNLGNALQALRRFGEAASAYRRALGFDAGNLRARSNLGNALAALGEYDEAERCYREALRRDPRFADAHGNLANLLVETGRAEESLAEYGNALALDPRAASVYCNLGNALLRLHRNPEAHDCFAYALRLEPRHAEAWNGMGLALDRAGARTEARGAFERALAIEPHNARAHANLGSLLRSMTRLSEAVEHGRRALELDPGSWVAANNLGNALSEAGDHQGALSCYRRALELRPDYAEAHSNLLLTLHYNPEFDARKVYQEHLAFGARHGGGVALAGAAPAPAPGPRAGGRLRVGYVSPDFRRHSVAHFIEPVLERHDRTAFEVCCYFDSDQPDEVTARLRGKADRWRDVCGWSDARLGGAILEDGIQILVDLAGHTARNRMRLFARRPAPVAVSWIGYPNTTGLAAVDYRLTDEWSDPPGCSDALHTEKLVRLGTGFSCYRPPADAPPVEIAPATRNGSVTFGCFNHLPKYNARVYDLWTEILRAAPGARLVLKSPPLGDPAVQQRVAGELLQRGIAAGRVELLGKVPDAAGHLAAYRLVDVALDTYPYHGTTTTCEALWMGVPVISLAGQAHVSRVGVSLLQRAGLPDWIAHTPAEYVAMAIRAASDVGRLAALRAAMRDRLRGSALMNEAALVAAVEEAYRRMWRGYTETNDDWKHSCDAAARGCAALAG